MNSPEVHSWLQPVFIGTPGRARCTKPFCTTCGSLDFRSDLWNGAAKQAGIAIRFPDNENPHTVLANRPMADRESLGHALIAGLRALPSRWLESEPLRTAIIEFQILRDQHGVDLDLEVALAGTTAGEEMARMREHSARMLKQRRRYEASQTPQAIEEWRRFKREARAKAHSERQLIALRRNQRRVELLSALAGQSPAERLDRFANDRDLALECIPTELIPSHGRDLESVGRATISALIARIGRRRGPWGNLRRMLEQLADRE